MTSAAAVPASRAGPCAAGWPPAPRAISRRHSGSSGGRPLSGEAEGAYRLGLLYLRGEGVVASLGDGIVWLRRAAEQGHAEAQYQLSLAYLHGGAEPRDRAVVSRRGGGPRGSRRAQSRADLSERLFGRGAAGRGLSLVPGGGRTGPRRRPGAARVSVRARHRRRPRLRRGAAMVCARRRARPCPGRTRSRRHP